MSNKHTGNVQPAIDLEEHRSKNVNAKAVVIHGFIPGTDEYVPVTAFDNGDGTYSTGKPNYAKKITVDGTDTYVGVAPLGSDQADAVWQAKKITVTGADTIITWADSNDSFDNVVTDLTALTYG